MLTLLDEIFIVVIGVGTLIEKIIYCERSVLSLQRMKMCLHGNNRGRENYDKRASKTEDKEGSAKRVTNKSSP